MTEPHPGSISIARLRALVDAYGAEPRRWPAADRSAAERLVAGSAEARAVVAAAARLDRLLDLAPPPAPTPDLVARVLAARDRQRRSGLRTGTWSRWPALRDALGLADGRVVVLRPAAALAFAAALGVATGHLWPTDAHPWARLAASSRQSVADAGLDREIAWLMLAPPYGTASER